jgi:hypothetical protein
VPQCRDSYSALAKKSQPWSFFRPVVNPRFFFCFFRTGFGWKVQICSVLPCYERAWVVQFGSWVPNRPLVSGQGAGGGGGGELASRAKAAARAWPCCDSCGGCTRSEPPRCQCLDAAPRGCHPACRDCVKSSLSVDPPVYQCMDRVPNFCQHRCTARAAAAAH